MTFFKKSVLTGGKKCVIIRERKLQNPLISPKGKGGCCFKKTEKGRGRPLFQVILRLPERKRNLSERKAIFLALRGAVRSVVYSRFFGL